LQLHPPPTEVIESLRSRITGAFPKAEVEVTGAAGHFEIKITSADFAGKNKLARQRMVFSAIKDLMEGNEAPVHAIDRMETIAPE